MDGLNSYSFDFAKKLFAVHPWLEEHAVVEPHPLAEAGSLLVRFSPEPVREHCELWISTDAEEVTVGFGMFHTHFDWPEPVDDSWWEDPLDFLGDLIDERVLIVDRTADGKWAGSSTVDRARAADMTNSKPDTVLHVRSWSGGSDREIPAPSGSS